MRVVAVLSAIGLAVLAAAPAAAVPSNNNVARGPTSVQYVPRSGPSATVNSEPKVRKREQIPIANDADASAHLCPLTMHACPISASLPVTLSEWIEYGFECVDFVEDLTSCGGCGTLDVQYDCTIIEDALGVSCAAGSCRVDSCKPGYAPALDGKTCVSLA